MTSPVFLWADAVGVGCGLVGVGSGECGVRLGRCLTAVSVAVAAWLVLSAGERGGFRRD